MGVKVFAALFVTLLACQATHQSPTIKDGDIQKIVAAVAEEALKLFSSVLAQAADLAKNLETNEAEIEKEIVDFAVEQATLLNNLLLKEIDQLRPNASDTGKAILDCVQAEGDKTNAALTSTFGQIGKCAGQEAPVVVDEIKHIISELNDLEAEFQTEVDTLKSCGLGDMLCLLQFGQGVVATVQTLPEAIQADIGKILELIQTIESDVQGCANEVIDGIKSSIQDIFNEAATCIQNKVH